MNILVCSLGASWGVIPESFALLDPERCPLYLNHPRRAAIDRLQREYRLQPPDEVWVCTTDDHSLDGGLEKLRHWRDLIDPGLPLRIWRTAEVGDVDDQVAGERVRELIYRVVLLASERADGDRLYLSLAGGRKTMSADMQRVGMLVGCDALLHVIAPPVGRMSERMQASAQDTFAAPLQEEDCLGLLPMVVGRGMRSDLLDIDAGDRPAIRAREYPLPWPDDGLAVTFDGDQRSLPAEIEGRERDSGRLLGNFMQSLVQHEHHENWRSLYRLPPREIERLRNTRLTTEHSDWLRALPKADLHRHIGGCLGIPAQRRVGRAIWESLSRTERTAALSRVEPLLQQREWEWGWPERLKAGVRSHCVAALLVEVEDDVLQHNLFGVTEPRRGLQRREPHGFAYYDRPGELTGSAVLSHPAALEPYACELLATARAEGIRYLELRGSPQKYRDHANEQIDFLGRVQRIAEEQQPDLTLRFIVIADRTRRDQIASTVQLAVDARDKLNGFVAGLDLAGDEQQDATDAPEKIADLFEPAFQACLPITIHAGEGTTAGKVWEAAYRLHADRVGHGLTLGGDQHLMERFRDRGICVELCPTSNHEVVGFDSHPYPLGQYWKQGVPLAVCTDNPGISRTDAAGELLKAAGFWPEMSLWDALAIIKQGFVHSFCPAEQKELLLKDADARIYQILIDRLRR